MFSGFGVSHLDGLVLIIIKCIIMLPLLQNKSFAHLLCSCGMLHSFINAPSANGSIDILRCIF